MPSTVHAFAVLHFVVVWLYQGQRNIIIKKMSNICQHLTCTKHNRASTMCIILEMYYEKFESNHIRWDIITNFCLVTAEVPKSIILNKLVEDNTFLALQPSGHNKTKVLSHNNMQQRINNVHNSWNIFWKFGINSFISNLPSWFRSYSRLVAEMSGRL